MRHFYSCTECVGPPECGRIHEHQLSCMVCVWWCRMLGWGSFIITDVSIISHRKHRGFTICCCSHETAWSFTKKDMLYLFWRLTMSSVRVCGPFFAISLSFFHAKSVLFLSLCVCSSCLVSLNPTELRLAVVLCRPKRLQIIGFKSIKICFLISIRYPEDHVQQWWMIQRIQNRDPKTFPLGGCVPNNLMFWFPIDISMTYWFGYSSWKCFV